VLTSSRRFPAPRYPTNEPFPSILSSTSPFPYPTPFPIPHSYDPPIDPIPLTRTELHTRVILQSIANQINESWLGGAAHSQMQVAGDSSDQAGLSERSAITARDFMVLRVPAHELVQSEADEMAKAKSESADVMRMWEEYGGLWVQTPDAGRRWVGVDPEPGIHREP
jgi:ribonuclease Z